MRERLDVRNARTTSVPTCARVPRRVEKSQSFGSSQVDMYAMGCAMPHRGVHFALHGMGHWIVLLLHCSHELFWPIIARHMGH